MLTDELWLATVVASLDVSGLEIPGPTADGAQPSSSVALPSFPSADVLELTIANANSKQSLAGAFDYYAKVKAGAARHGAPLKAETTLLDFGCGWGRVARFFLREVQLDHIFGVDVVADLTEAAARSFGSQNFTAVRQLGTLPFDDETFDLVVANAVFSHLSEELNLRWIAELRRTMRPGGLAFLTIFDLERLEARARSAAQWFAKLGLDMETARQTLGRGEFFWHTTKRAGELEGYGMAAIPLQWLDAHWTDGFEILEIVDHSQAIVVLRAI